MIKITDLAKSKVLELMEAEEEKGLALRVTIRGRGPGGFQTELNFAGQTERSPDDIVEDAGGFEIITDPKSAESLDGATVDFVEGAYQSGFKVENPNPLWKDPLAKAVQEVIDTKINPSVASHGGFIALLDVKDNKAYIQLGGGCQGCGMADVTLKQGIEVMIKEAVPQISEILDTTDHAGGTNPYYAPSKGGGPSPMGQ
jgi:Fe/S biogenesis protein NfuA